MNETRTVADGRGRVPAGVIRVAAVAALVGLAATPAAAVAPNFEFNVAFGQTWTDNAGYTDTIDDSDVTGALEVDIPYTRERQTYTLDLLYRPSYKKYKDFDDLDNLEHLVRIDLENRVSRNVTWRSGVSYFRTQDQALSNEFVSDTTYLTYRSKREEFSAEVGVDRKVSPSWNVGGRIRGRTLEIEPIDDFVSGAPQEQFGDQVSISSEVGATKELARDTSVNFGYRYTGYTLDLSEDETTHRLFAEVKRTVSRKVNVGFGGGMAYRNFETDDEIEYEGSANVARTFKRGVLSAFVGRSARNGDAIPGGSVSNTAGLSYSEELRRRWRWSAMTRYSIRDAVDSDESDLDYWRSSVTLDFRGPSFTAGSVAEALGFRFRGSWIEQDGSTDPDLNSGYYIVSAAIVAYFGF